jgi:hypothetical protein
MDSVTISGGNVEPSIDFRLYDFCAISGMVTYQGVNNGDYIFYVGIFDTTGFDMNNLQPDYGTEGYHPFEPEFAASELQGDLAPGTYFVGAYLDIGGDGNLDNGTDPMGFYETGGQPIPITVMSGQDFLECTIALVDPVPVASSSTLTWHSRVIVKGHPLTERQRIAAFLSEALEAHRAVNPR